MTYFTPNEIWVGAISSLSEVALVLPRSSYEDTLLVTKEGDSCWATFLNPSSYQYHSFEILGDESDRKGLIVPDIKIELDQSSICDNSNNFKMGSMIRESDKLSIVTRSSRPYGSSYGRRIQILNNLKNCDERESAGYKKWRVILGEGERKRVLWDVDLDHETSSI
jgi:hypothetical protein